ncbi:DUF5689 domain-containing protein [Flavobacterium sp. RHBU_24]|uniref:DUF5689 domain-containing protein n=1 Tax=Flavobacterium sp. RHBU_24 TaxID=3391185 RepID=UPI003984F721
MKATFYKSTLVVLMAAGMFTSCINDDDYNTPNLECDGTTLVKNMEPQAIPATANIALYTENAAIVGDDVIEAYVTSSDQGGNFFKTISFQTLDKSFAFSVAVDVNSTFVNFEPGRKVLIKLDGLYTQITDGALELGGIFLTDTGEAQVGRLPETQYLTYLNRSCTVVSEEDLVQHVSLTQIKNDSYLNKLVEIDNVQFTDAAVGNTYYDVDNDLGGATNHLITDKFGNTLIFRTSSFANFSGKVVPNKSGKIRGVLTKFGSDYQFLARTENDIKLTETRFAPEPPFYTEDFQEAIDGTNFNIDGWANIAQTGARVWREEAFSGNGYAEFSAFGSGDAINVAWLVSPEIDFGTNTTKILAFDIAQHHLDGDTDGNKLEVFVSTDFTGNVATATWIPVAANLPNSDTAWYEFLGTVADVSSVSGSNIRIAFKFTGSGTNTALDGAFQVDNLRAFGG